MTLRHALSRAGFALLLLASLAMSATAFAHRSPEPDPEMLAYLEMGGTLEELCGAADPEHHLAAGCEACRISANALAPEAAPRTQAPVVYAAALYTSVGAASPGPRRAHVTPPSRAPPVL